MTPPRLWDALRSGESAVAAWLGGVEFAPAALAQRPTAASDRAGLVAALDSQPGNDRTQTRRLLEPGSVAVVCGQQPAVGGGPLYSLVKAAHAVALAEAVTASGRPCVPIFWCASEDHDLGEAGHADLIAQNGDLHRHAADLGAGRASLRFRPARAWWDGFQPRLAEVAGPGLGSAAWNACEPQADEGMGAWTCRVLTRLLPGLVAVEGHRLRPLWRESARRALARWPEQALAAIARDLEQHGCAPAFPDLGRPPVFADRRDGRVAIDSATALRLLDDDPTAFSPGAALRPVLQQAALPAVAFIAGPGEVAYHAQLGPIYAAAEVPRPQLVPRISATLLPAWIARAADRWGLDPARPASLPPTLPAPLATELAALDGALAALAAAPLAGDAARRRASGLARLGREAQRLRASLARGERRHAGLLPPGAVQAWLRPRGSGQDRTLCLAQALVLGGPGLAGLLVGSARSTAAGDSAIIRL